METLRLLVKTGILRMRGENNIAKMREDLFNANAMKNGNNRQDKIPVSRSIMLRFLLVI